MQLCRHRRVALAAGLAAFLGLTACSSGGGGTGSAGGAPKSNASRGARPSGAEAALDGRDEGASRDARAARKAARPSAPPVTVTWEALAVEREMAESFRFRRSGRGTVENQKIVLVNESHPEAKRSQRGRTSQTKDGLSVAVISDEDMTLLLQGFEQAGFQRYAKPTGSLESTFDREDARGRITVDLDGSSRTIVSLRGQGLNPETKGLPQVYSTLKQTISALRNATPTLNVRTGAVQGNAPTR